MSKGRILVAEDEQDVRELIVHHLKRDGYDPVEAGTGKEAQQLLDRESFGLAILDWMMPEISGLELCRKIRAEGIGKPPILMVTARADTADATVLMA